MDIKITPTNISGSIYAINSKSHAHRLLICAALSKEPVTLICPSISDDIEATARCLNAFGTFIKRIDTGYEISPAATFSANADLNCEDSGSTLRFLLPLAAALGIDSKFYMSGRLPRRPISALSKQLKSHGCSIEYEAPHVLCCNGKLLSGEYSLPGNISSQFFTGLLFALPLSDGNSIINIDGKPESMGYINMTLDVLKSAGIKIFFEENSFKIPGNQTYSMPLSVTAEGDWSAAAFWLAMGAFSRSGITCEGLNHRSLQKDKRIVRILRRFGALVTTTPTSVTVKRQKLHGIVINAADIPDLVPVLAVVAVAAEGTTTITKAGRLRLKESDRLRSVTEMLRSLGADITEYHDKLIINGASTLKGGTVDSFGDHRIAMAAACASVICTDPVTIYDAHCISKSYPAFWQDFEKLGGKTERQETL